MKRVMVVVALLAVALPGQDPSGRGRSGDESQPPRDNSQPAGPGQFGPRQEQLLQRLEEMRRNFDQRLDEMRQRLDERRSQREEGEGQDRARPAPGQQGGQGRNQPQPGQGPEGNERGRPQRGRGSVAQGRGPGFQGGDQRRIGPGRGPAGGQGFDRRGLPPRAGFGPGPGMRMRMLAMHLRMMRAMQRMRGMGGERATERMGGHRPDDFGPPGIDPGRGPGEGVRARGNFRDGPPQPGQVRRAPQGADAGAEPPSPPARRRGPGREDASRVL